LKRLDSSENFYAGAGSAGPGFFDILEAAAFSVGVQDRFRWRPKANSVPVESEFALVFL
jgi:hypothetical protein